MTRSSVTIALAVASSIASAALHGQSPATPPARPSTTVGSSPVEVSGVLFPQFIYGGATGARSSNRFELERAYLTARAKVADRTSIRLTGDVFRPAAGASYTMRAKYAYGQYEYWVDRQGPMGANAQARIGMQPTLIIDQVEQYWPRYVAQSVHERAGFFSSSDLGVSTTLAFAGGSELFGMVSNGTGYTQAENDRFKDWSLRLTLAPFGRANGGGLIVSPWLYKGARQSAIVGGEGRRKDRAGVFAGFRTPALVLGGDFAVATNENESGTAANLVTSDERGRVLSAFTLLKPLAMLQAGGSTAWGIVLRYDRIESDDAYVPSGGAFPVQDGRFLVAGLTHDVNNRLSWALDYQQQSPRGASAPALDLRTYNVHSAFWF
jgi:hypothetical protein